MRLKSFLIGLLTIVAMVVFSITILAMQKVKPKAQQTATILVAVEAQAIVTITPSPVVQATIKPTNTDATKPSTTVTGRPEIVLLS